MDPEPVSLQAMAQRLKALGHPGRLAILRQVVQGPLEGTPAGELQVRLAMPGSTLSHHLSDLSDAGLLRATRRGTTIRYAAQFDQLKALTEYLWQDCCGAGCRDPRCP